ncbi:hypothetical protein [Delftia sp. PS-11]|uniref:hypothetical protein n=1 Tax=Delftia sp. PS-11 TaxID=2767222 RepID=UPI002454AC83|nr:hypothetical protein [Delftia sp. PS-11]KAJ8745687.1 hypothetical protein H9T68_05530 [Delftia sp. PS-11]
MSSIDVFYVQGQASLSATEDKKLQTWLRSSLVDFPIISSISIESNAYANSLEDAEELAKKRGELLKNIFLKQIPSETFIRLTPLGHTKNHLEMLPNTDVAFIDLRPDVEKLNLPPCSPIPIKPK